jgi:putative oxidoreductase
MGLILMRLVIGFALMRICVPALLNDPSIPIAIMSVLLGGSAIFLVVGLYTAIVGTLVALIEIGGMFMSHGQSLLYLLIAASGAALAMLGPGAWSVDARLFGWRRIEPSPRNR